MQRRPTGMGQRTGLHYLEVVQNLRRYKNRRNGVPDVSSEEAALQFVNGGGSVRRMPNSKDPKHPEGFPHPPPGARPFEVIVMQTPIIHNGYPNGFNYNYTSQPAFLYGNYYNPSFTIFPPTTVLPQFIPHATQNT
ncbi:unnamed protein product [Rotaria magnacalcarata]|uniref:Uncharacterized protein n=1 Tax=Rotaria magnacalcarata TaxID=392030 RepID=A0A816L0R9_9BILA|nr:unnamed protein product [Rotaria magnacalcarata]CAF1553408.1 unnamed protein product [Rotaria magnacalcarata]CAF1928573.1 unnamed protein product [Rotaria magnacalcarata]CAF2061150.1 unnamed protein product [Rotaria magnacalcarata]CAF2069597.1 unnamed protein product [Rotaria magnacalcarata]